MCEIIEKIRLEAKVELLKEMIDEKIITVQEAAKKIGLSEEAFKKLLM